MRLRQKVSVALGVTLLLIASYWTFYYVPGLLAFDEEGGEGDAGTGEMDNVTFMEGRFGVMGLMSNASDEEDFLNLTLDHFKLQWHDVIINGSGIFDAETGEPLFGEEAEENVQPGKTTEEERPSFPPLGVEEKDYEIWSDWLGETVTAAYVGKQDVEGLEVNVYRVNISERKIEPEEEDEDEIMGETAYLYSERTTYYLEPRTTIPVTRRWAYRTPCGGPTSRSCSWTRRKRSPHGWARSGWRTIQFRASTTSRRCWQRSTST